MFQIIFQIPSGLDRSIQVDSLKRHVFSNRLMLDNLQPVQLLDATDHFFRIKISLGASSHSAMENKKIIRIQFEPLENELQSQSHEFLSCIIVWHIIYSETILKSNEKLPEINNQLNPAFMFLQYQSIEQWENRNFIDQNTVYSYFYNAFISSNSTNEWLDHVGQDCVLSANQVHVSTKRQKHEWQNWPCC